MHTKKSKIDNYSRNKKKTRNYFWAFFATYFFLFTFFWFDSIKDFGFFYIMGIGCFTSFFCAWASSLFMILMIKGK